MTSINLNGQELPIAFTVKALHDFARSQGIEYVQDALQSLAFLAKFKEGYKLEIEDLESISGLSVAAINAGARKKKQKVDIDEDFIYEALVKDPSKVQPILAEVVDSLNDYLETFGISDEKKKKLTSQIT